MQNNKNTGKDNALSENIAGQEGLNAKEIALDISKQMNRKEKDGVAQHEGVDRRELSKDASKQMLGAKKTSGKTSANMWIFGGIAVLVLALVIWGIVANT